MTNILVFTTDLPFFPGKNGHDFFNLRHLAQHHRVGVVAPRYDHLPSAGVENLRRAIQKSYFWPDPAGPSVLFVDGAAIQAPPAWVKLLPRRLRQNWLNRRLGIGDQPDGAYERLAILANCAPQLLAALRDHHWQAHMLIQTSLAPWMQFLPRSGAKIVYFHDVRSDYLARSVQPADRQALPAVKAQEQEAARLADAVGFVSDLDRRRASTMLCLPAAQEVAPIPVDLDYYVPRPADWSPDPRKIVLFTGHLRHPPNVDAAIYFLQEVWPLVLQASPDAVFQAVGLTPHPDLEAAIRDSPRAELHPNVPDIRPYFWNASVYVVPMRFGGGVRQKIFEAWAMHLPVVSTTMGAEGIDAKSDVNCWLEDSPSAMATRLADILAGGAPTDVVAQAATQVRQTNSIPAAAACFERLGRKGISQRRTQPYRLLYDLRWMRIGASGGTEQMTHELLQAISAVDHTNFYRTYIPRSTYHELKFPQGFRCEPHFCDDYDKRGAELEDTFTNQLSQSLGLQTVLTPEMRTLRAWRKMDFDFVHSMVGYIHPDLACFPQVLTALDLQHVHYPQFFGAEEWKERDRLYRTSAEQARHIICISEYTRQDMHRHYKVPLEKMTTVWLIPSHQVWSPPALPIRQRLLQNMGLYDPFLYFPAHGWTHKNHARLVECFALILSHIPKNLKLVFSGRPFPEDHPALGLIGRHGLESRVRHLGYRSPLEVQALLHGCFALVFPSIFEGFGIPVMDAIIAGKPVVCSNSTSLPEIAGDAALTFDPFNIHDMGGRLLEVINDPARREALLEAGRKRRVLFSARISAIKTLAVYQQVHAKLYS